MGGAATRRSGKNGGKVASADQHDQNNLQAQSSGPKRRRRSSVCVWGGGGGWLCPVACKAACQHRERDGTVSATGFDFTILVAVKHTFSNGNNTTSSRRMSTVRYVMSYPSIHVDHGRMLGRGGARLTRQITIRSLYAVSAANRGRGQFWGRIHRALCPWHRWWLCPVRWERERRRKNRS